MNGDILKELRIKAKLTQKELAEKVYTSQQAVQQWETGKSVPQSDRLSDISKALGCSILDISCNDNPGRNILINIDYSVKWNETINRLRSFPVANDLEEFIKNAAVRYAEEQQRYYNGKMSHHLCLTQKEHDIYKYWKENTYNGKDILFWECFFPTDFFLTTSEFHPLIAAKAEAVIEGLAGYEILIGKLDALQEAYYPESL